MRPLQLTVSAFGAYADEQFFDLASLGTQGIYLITGDTGAGKTTIFDAIVYALYGRASGSTRDDANFFRSKYADENVATFVELVFSYHGKEYKIRRNPEYLRPSKRGGGYTKESADAQLYLPDGRIISQNRKVNQEINRILALDVNQFCQIAMIAQGEFLELLNASSEDRKKIFSQIFKTSAYGRLEEEFNQASNQLAKECEKISDSIVQYSKDIQAPEQFAQQLSLLGDNQLTTAEILNLIAEINDVDSINGTALSSQLNALCKEMEEQLIRLNDLKTYRKKQEEYKDLERRLEREKVDYRELAIDSKLEQLSAKSEQIEQNKIEISELEKSLVKYVTIDKLKADRKKHSKNLSALETKINDFKSKLVDIEKELIQAEEELKTLSDIELKAEKTRQQLIELTRSQAVTTELIKELQQLKLTSDKLENAQKNYRDKQQETLTLKTKYDSNYQLYLDEQAGILGAELKLKAGACPVCGSLEHPAIAGLSDNAPTRTELEGQKNDLEKANNLLEKASQQAAKFNTKISTIKAKINTMADDLDLEGDYLALQNDFEKKKKAYQAEIKELELVEQQILAKIKRKDSLKMVMPTLREKIKDNQELIKQTEQERHHLSSEIKVLEAKIISEKDKLAFDDKKSAEKVIKQLLLEQKEYRQQKDYAESKQQLYFEKTTKLKAQLEVLQQELSEQSVLANSNMEQLELEINANNSKKQQLEIKKETLSNRLSRNQSLLMSITKAKNQLIGKENRLRWLKSLADTAKGKLSGKEKITLETFVQMTYFERIIARANIRLMAMTAGQYELKRSQEGNKRSQSGLDLAVIDHYNGSERSVKTLSGGESFKASLALALGLSDEVQASSGGIKIDSLFVDEGFGTLDEESLSQALKTLINLSAENRLIGIISHVAELKTKIDKQIIVRKDKIKGAYAEIIC